MRRRRFWFRKIKEKVATRFAELRRAFRTMDETAAGAIDLATFKTALPFMLNLGVPERIMTRLASIADFDGNGMINFAEFARLLTAESLKTIKQTLHKGNSTGKSHKLTSRQNSSQSSVDRNISLKMKLKAS